MLCGKVFSVWPQSASLPRKLTGWPYIWDTSTIKRIGVWRQVIRPYWQKRLSTSEMVKDVYRIWLRGLPSLALLPEAYCVYHSPKSASFSLYESPKTADILHWPAQWAPTLLSLLQLITLWTPSSDISPVQVHMCRQVTLSLPLPFRVQLFISFTGWDPMHTNLQVSSLEYNGALLRKMHASAIPMHTLQHASHYWKLAKY